MKFGILRTETTINDFHLTRLLHRFDNVRQETVIRDGLYLNTILYGEAFANDIVNRQSLQQPVLYGILFQNIAVANIVFIPILAITLNI